MWLPNRFLDLVDIFRFDIGLGPSYGAALRVTEHGQMAYRRMDPFSLRVGAFGRKAPILLETSDEIGIGPYLEPSTQRQVCPSEIGIGLDLFIVGGYGGICLGEIPDFFAGLFFIDLKGDDL